MKAGYKMGSGAKRVIAEAKDKHEGAVLSASASKAPMAVAGTPILGKKPSMNLGRPGRKMGGRVGADCAPLSTAAKTS